VKPSLQQRILARRADGEIEPRFAERLLDGIDRIEREFDGDERARLLGLVEETLERHVTLREHVALARAALDALRADQTRLLELIGFAFGREGSTTLH